MRYLQQLGMGKNQAMALTKAEATAKITQLLQEKDNQPPTPPQLQLLEVSCTHC